MPVIPTIGRNWRAMAAIVCVAMSLPPVATPQPSEKRAETSGGVVVLGEDDFERVPEAVRGQTLGAPGVGVRTPTGGSGEVLQFDPRRDAAADIRAAVTAANREGKHVLLEVGGTWCPYCKILDRFFEEQPAITELRRKNFLLVKVNFSDENQNAEALSKYPPVRGFPHFFVLDGKGGLLRSQRVATLGTNTGYSPERFRAFLEASAPKR